MSRNLKQSNAPVINYEKYENEIKEIIPKVRTVRIFDYIFIGFQLFTIGVLGFFAWWIDSNRKKFNNNIDNMSKDCPYLTCPDNQGTDVGGGDFQAEVQVDPNHPEYKPLPTGIEKIDGTI